MNLLSGTDFPKATEATWTDFQKGKAAFTSDEQDQNKVNLMVLHTQA